VNGSAAGNGSPSNGEIARRLIDLTAEVRESRKEMAEAMRQYVRADVFDARQATDAVMMRGLEGEVHSLSKRIEALREQCAADSQESNRRLEAIDERRRADRMWLVGGLAFPIIILLVGAVVTARGLG
jgi:putative NADH-flavin reductase